MAERHIYRVRSPYSVTASSTALEELGDWTMRMMQARPNIIDPTVECDTASGSFAFEFSWEAISPDGVLHPLTRIERQMRDRFRNLGVEAVPGRTSIEPIPAPVVAG